MTKHDQLVAIESEIKESFAGVVLNGVSWNEARVIDMYYSDQAQKEARNRDVDQSWTELVDDPNWDSEPGIGGFCFLDANGFRYYLPACMIRSLKRGFDVGIAFHLSLPEKEELRNYS